MTPLKAEQKSNDAQLGGLQSNSIQLDGIQLDKFERQIAQKFIVDFRYFEVECSDNENSLLERGKEQTAHNLTPMVELPEALKQLIIDTDIGGVILFSENMVNTAQIVKLTTDLHQASQLSHFQQPLFISIDQEGGRVVRTPRNQSTSFAGNMAIAATQEKVGDYYAKEVGHILAIELKALGINLNYAPDVDVNINPNNPVINTRAFSDNSQKVADLGLSVMNAMQQENIIATLKHFPGHGDTYVDSHVGLPIVKHDLATAEKIDLLPFQWAIDHGEPAMIMTAHIQYPYLDNSTFTNSAGQLIVKPATMSRKILTDLLRNKMKFKGVIATDALDMAGVASFYQSEEAVLETFRAGADLALMPYRIRCVKDIINFKQFIKNIANKMRNTKQDKIELEQSLIRINALKKQYDLYEQAKEFTADNLAENINRAEGIVGCNKHKEIEQQLAEKSLTLLKNNAVLPLNYHKNTTLHIVAYNMLQVTIFIESLNKYWGDISNHTLSFTVGLLSTFNQQQNMLYMQGADYLIILHSSGKQNVVEVGGTEDVVKDTSNQSEKQQRVMLQQIQQEANEIDIPQVFIQLQSPYSVEKHQNLADAVIVSYDASIYQKLSKKSTQQDKEADISCFSESYDAVASAILLPDQMLGHLPITLL